MNELQNKLIELTKLTLTYLKDEELTLDSSLAEIGFNSVEFIKLIVNIENEFNIEFVGTEHLIDENLYTIEDIYNLLLRKIK